MKIKHLLLFTLFACTLMSCEKDPEPDQILDNREPEQIVAVLAEELSSADSIGGFVASFKNLQMTAEETQDGLTLFAPLDGEENAGARLSPSPEGQRRSQSQMGTSELKDHIVKGVYTASDLSNGVELITLSGKKLVVKAENGHVYLNGVPVLGEPLTSKKTEVAYVVKEKLSGTSPEASPKSATLKITVMDATFWTPGHEEGAAAEHANVVLYRSKKDYAESNSSFQLQTDAEGVVVFEDLEPGEYFLKAFKEDRSNIFYKSEEPIDGYYRGLAAAGIFQSQEEVSNSAQQENASPGSIRWVDQNADGLINSADFVKLPEDQVKIRISDQKEVKVIIGYPNGRLHNQLSAEEVRELLVQANNQVDVFHKELSIIDGLLSQEGNAADLGTSYQGMSEFAFAANHPVVTKVWQNAYHQIQALDNIIDNESNASPEDLLQARGLRAFIYQQLYFYFGNIPILNNDEALTNSPSEEIHAFLEHEWQTIAAELPQSGLNSPLMNSAAIKTLLAKLYLHKKMYQEATNLAMDVIHSGQYHLESNSAIFSTDSNETIWKTSSPISGYVKNYFDNRTTWPYLRLTEVYLLVAESEFNLGNKNLAFDLLNTLNDRSGNPPLFPSDDFKNSVAMVWQEEMRKEGTSFAAFVRWGLAEEKFGNKGYAIQHSLLPIPQVAIDQNPELIQNPGY